MPWWLLLRRRWGLVLGLTVAGLLAAAAYALQTPPSYAASTTLFFSPSSGSTASELNQGTAYTQNLVKSFAQVATSERVLSPVVRQLDLDTSPARLARTVTAGTAPDSLLLTINVVSPEPRLAARTADAVAEQLTTVVADLSPVSRTVGRTIRVTIVAEAQVPEAPVNRAELVLVAGPLLGLMLGLGLAGLRELLDDRVRTPKHVRDVSGLAVLGAVEGHQDERAGVAGTPSEAVRRLRTNLLAALRRQRLSSVLITAPSGDQTAASLAVELAVALVEGGVRTLLVDADLRRSTVTARLGLPAGPGVAEVVRGSVAARGAVRPWGGRGLMVLTAGSTPEDPGALLSSPRLGALVEDLEEAFDVVLLHSPSVLGDADAGIVSAQTQGTLVVADSRTTTRGELRRALSALDLADAQVLGVVLTSAVSEDAAPSRGRRMTLYDQDGAPTAAASGSSSRRRPAGARRLAPGADDPDARTASAVRNG